MKNILSTLVPSLIIGVAIVLGLYVHAKTAASKTAAITPKYQHQIQPEQRAYTWRLNNLTGEVERIQWFTKSGDGVVDDDGVEILSAPVSEKD